MARAAASGAGRQSLAAKTATAAAVTIGAIAVGLLGTGGTYAFLNASNTSDSAAVLTAGTAELSVTNPAAMAGFYPGQTQWKTFTVTNTGHVTLGLSVTSTNVSNTTSELQARVAKGNCKSEPVGVASGALQQSVMPGKTVTLCLVVKLPAPADATAAGESATVTIKVLGTQQ